MGVDESGWKWMKVNRDISETALPITPQNVGKLTSETAFGHWKMVYRPWLRTIRAFSQSPLTSQAMRGEFIHQNWLKTLDSTDGLFANLSSPSRCCPTVDRWLSRL